MTNKQIISDNLRFLKLRLGCYDEQIECLTAEQLNKIIEHMIYDGDSSDLQIAGYTVEVRKIDQEIDIYLTY